MLLRYTLVISTIFEELKMKMSRHFIIIFLLFFLCSHVYSQQQIDSLKPNRTDSAITIKSPAPLKPDSLKRPAHQVIKPLKPVIAIKDTSVLNIDSLTVFQKPVLPSYHSVINSLLLSGKFINVNEPSIYFIAQKKQAKGKEFIFYALCVVVLILGIFKTFYNKYFNDLFRVFFNTSIRQTQLTDQLLQAKLPSFILNIFFAISVGFYIWLLFKHYQPPRLINNHLLLPFCIAGVGALYFIKYCILKFIGWMSGMQQAADSYIFVIFLVNKITGIILVPFTILLAFSTPVWTNLIVIFSLFMIVLFFLSRYVKTYSVLEYRFPLEPLHFVIYVTAVEILPILISYKLIVDYIV